MKPIARTLDVSRSNLVERLKDRPIRAARRQRQSRADDAWLLPLIRGIADTKPTYGYRRITVLLSRELRILGRAPVNHKRVYRIMRENALTLTAADKRPTRTHDGKIITLKSDLGWCSDGLRASPRWDSQDT